MRRLFLLSGIALSAIASLPASAQSQDEVIASALQPALNGAHRSAEYKARDQYRHPLQTLQFFGIKPNQQVIEITPGAGGWYAEILAPYLKDHGVYIAANTSSVGLSPGGAEATKRNNDKQRAKFALHPEVFGKAAGIEFEMKAPKFGPNNSADAVLTFRNVHNWAMNGTEALMFKAIFDVLKPGGTFGVVDHRAAEGQTKEQFINTGYLSQSYVIGLAEKAGFKLEASSEVNANAKDTKNHPEGVWTLPPTLALKDKDRAKYQAIGESDRMTLRFIKPVFDK